jgi:hypothetical protein
MRLFKDFFYPLPTIEFSSTRDKVLLFAQLLILSKLCDVLVALSRMLLDHARLPYSLAVTHQNAEVGDRSWWWILMLVFYAPLYEELAFRLHLKPYLKNICLSGSLVLVLVLKIAAHFFVQIDFPIFYLNLLRDVSFAGFFFFLFYRLMKNVDYKGIYEKRQKFIYISSIALWAFLHFNNYGFTSVQELPIIVLTFASLCFYGFVFSYIRLKIGLLAGIFFHVLTVAIKLLW